MSSINWGRTSLLAAVAAAGALAQRPIFETVNEPVPVGASLYAPQVLAAADFDGDGDVDLLTDDGPRLNDGAGRFFLAPTPLTGLAGVVRAVVGDFDGDGDVDFVAIRQFHGPASDLYLNGGGATFSLAALPFAGAGGPAPLPLSGNYPVVAGDFDGDGDDDLIGTNYVGATPSYVRATGGGFFIDGAAAFGVPSLAVPLDAYDFDGDGRDELVASRGSPFNTVAALSYASGAAVSLGTISAAVDTLLGYSRFTRGDFDGDGLRDDCALTVGTSHVVAIRGPSGFVSTSTVLQAPLTFGAVDLDGDGKDELLRITLSFEPGIEARAIVGGAVGPVVAVVPDLHGYYFSPTAPLILGARALPTVDLDGDGDRDALGATPAGAWRPLFNGGGTLRDPYADDFPGILSGRGALPVDFDGDGDADLVAPHSFSTLNGTVVTTARNDGAGRFTTVALPDPSAFGGSDNPANRRNQSAFAVGDFDGDGDEDVLVAAAPLGGPPAAPFQSPQTYLLRSNGSGGFTGVIATPVPSPGLPGVYLASGTLDFDSDGDLDVALVRSGWIFGPGGIDVQANDGNGVFSLAATHTLANARGIAAGDLDGDGDADLAVATSNGVGGVYWNAGGVFTPALVALGTAGNTVAIGDLDGDLDPDLLFGASQFLNQGGQSFVAGSTFATSAAAYWGATIADFDLDGTNDVLYAGSFLRGLGGGAFAADVGVRPYSIPTTLGGSSVVGTSFFGVDGPYRTADFDRDGDLDLLLPTAQILANTTRQLAPGAAMRAGGAGALRLFGAPGELVDVVVSSTLLAAPVVVAPFGLVHVDPIASVVVGSVALDALGLGELSGAVPSNPAYVGLELHWQASYPASVRVSNLLTTKIEGF